ncbi:hypothetical protein MIMGU_mgv11b020849mg, partial [Erythranthe guttata]
GCEIDIKSKKMELVAVSTFVLVAVLAWFIFPRHKNLPPGPHPFPIIGNLHQLGKNPHWATISPADQTAALEAAHGHYKIPMTFLPIGKEWRKFRKLGREEMFMASRLESSQTLRLEKLERKCDYAGEFCDRGKAVNIGEAIFTAMVNLMFATLFSTEDASFDSNNESSSDDQELLKTTIEGIANIMGRPNFADFFPILKPFDLQGQINQAGINQDRSDRIHKRPSVLELSRERDPNDPPYGFLVLVQILLSWIK